MFETLSDPEMGFSGDATKAGLSKALAPGKSFWEFLELPGNEHRLHRFGVAMQGSTKSEPQHAILNGELSHANRVTNRLTTGPDSFVGKDLTGSLFLPIASSSM